jgi:Flp pilus assembly protein TadD
MLRPRSIGLLLAFVTLLVYLPVTSYYFVNFDDPLYITANPVVQNGLTWSGVQWAFAGTHVCNWHPLTWLSHMADCEAFRLNPAGPHLVNVLFHAVNAALLFTWLFWLTGKLWPAAFIAALFACHPLHVESVAWISERKDVLSTFFALLTLLCYTRFVKTVTSGGEQEASDLQNPSPAARTRTRFYWLAVFFFALALLSKPMPVTLPLVMLLLDYWPLQRAAGDKWPVKTWLRLALEKWPFFLLAAASCGITILAQHDAVSSLTRFPLSYRLENVMIAYVGYLWKMIWPAHLAIFYPLHAPLAWSKVAESAVILTGISAIVWLERKGRPWLLAGWLWFLVTLVPVIGLVQVGGQSMADRYSYFPLIGIFLALAFTAQALTEHFFFLKKGFAVAAVLILGACVLLTEKQLRYWRDSESLFTHALTVTESDLACLCLGAAFQEQNRMSEALGQYLMAAELNPKWSMPYDDIGRLLDDERRCPEAVVYYRKALQWEPDSPSLHDNLGIILMELGRFDEAMKEFATAARVNTTYAPPHFLMGRLLLMQGRDVEAVPHLREALRIAPDNLEMLILTASVLAADENAPARNGAEALELAAKALKLPGGQQPAVFDVLAMAQAEMGKFDLALQTEQQAIQLVKPDDPENDVALLQRRLQCYQSRQPWRESFKLIKAERPAAPLIQ